MPVEMNRCRLRFKFQQILLLVLMLLGLILIVRLVSDKSHRNSLAEFTRKSIYMQRSKHTYNEQYKDWHNYLQIEEEAKSTGPGEQGAGVMVPESDNELKESLYRVNGYNARASDLIPLNRSLRDIRHPDCQHKQYLKQLSTVSVIIPFHQEHWTPLLRTVVSIIKRSPPGLIKEILLVDDASRKSFLGVPLDKYLKEHLPLARVIRTGSRQGLIRTRVIGARQAKGDILIFLDSHCEVNVNWLPPLIDPIVKNYKVVTCPFIDVISYDTFEYKTQDEGARGIFDWNLLYKRIPRLKSDALHPSDPFESPVMAGGLFAINKRWFWELGGYDEGLDIWGGEQYELSFKLWQCGGKMLDIPCSRIGHVYRKFAPFPNNAKGNFLARNFKRVATVWMDEYAEYLYMRKPDIRNEDTLDLTNQKAIRTNLNCKNFSWFMENVAFDLPRYFPMIEPLPGAQGELRMLSKNNNTSNKTDAALCIDFKFGGSGSPVYLSPCISEDSRAGGQQNLQLTWRGDIRAVNSEICLDCSDHRAGGTVLLFSCHGGHGNQFFKYNLRTKQIITHISGLCMEGHPGTKSLTVETCNISQSHQFWQFDKYNSTLLESMFTATGHEQDV